MLRFVCEHSVTRARGHATDGRSGALASLCTGWAG